MNGCQKQSKCRNQPNATTGSMPTRTPGLTHRRRWHKASTIYKLQHAYRGNESRGLTCQHHLAGHKDEQHNLGLLHAVDQAREQLRLVLQAAAEFLNTRYLCSVHKVTSCMTGQTPDNHSAPATNHVPTRMYTRNPQFQRCQTAAKCRTY